MRRWDWGEVLHWFFPARCCGCDRVLETDIALCDECALLIEWLTAACRRCAQPIAAGPGICLACLAAPPPFASARSLALYGGPIADGLRRLKFGDRPDVAEPFGRLLGALRLPLDLDAIVPVPLANDRLAERGYNQAALLARAMRRRLPLWDHALRREKTTLRQARLPLDARRRNVRGVFGADASLVRGRAVLLVDDVMTTGETARACTRALLDAGARRVDVLTAARAVP